MDTWWDFHSSQGKEGSKINDTNRYHELKAEVQRELRVDKQQQLEGICVELEAANSKGNSRQLIQIVKSMYPVSEWWKFDGSYTNHTQVERVLWRLVPWWRMERNWRRILEARASTTLFRSCLCHPLDNKSQSHRSWWGPSRTVQSRRDSTGQNAQDMYDNLRNWWVATFHFRRNVILNIVQITEQLLLYSHLETDVCVWWLKQHNYNQMVWLESIMYAPFAIIMYKLQFFLSQAALHCCKAHSKIGKWKITPRFQQHGSCVMIIDYRLLWRHLTLCICENCLLLSLHCWNESDQVISHQQHFLNHEQTFYAKHALLV